MNKNHEKLAKEWFDRAVSDFKFARAGEKETGEHGVTCFLCHQAVEKALKGLIVLAGEIPQKTHHLGLLMGSAALKYPSLSGMAREVRRLDKFYVTARYPGGSPLEFELKDAAFAITTAEHVLDVAKAEMET